MAAIDGPLDAFGNVKVNQTRVIAEAGYAVLVGEQHDGAVGAAAMKRAVQVSRDGRIQTGRDTLMWEDFFNHTVINSRKYPNVLATMTTQIVGGFAVLNSGSSVATATGNLFRTYKAFPLTGNGAVRFHSWFALSALPQANNVIQLGVGIASGVATTLSSDGIFMVIDSAGALSLNSYYNNATPITSGPVSFTWTANKVYHLELVLHRDMIEMYLDKVLYATLVRPVAAPAAGGFSQSQFGHLIAQIVNTGVTASAQKLSIAGWHMSQMDLDLGKSYAATRTGNGDSLLSNSDGNAVASLTQAANSAAAASAVLSNTAGGYGITVLDGRFQFAAVAGAETDYALFAFLVPAGTPTVPGRTLVVTGVTIDVENLGAAVATTPTLLEWGLAVGSTGVSLATSDSAAARAPMRKLLGSCSLPIGTAIGGRADRVISEDFVGMPLPAEPGTYVHTILRMPVGTATVGQIVRGTVLIKGYWE